MSTRFQNELAQGFDVNALNELSDSDGSEAVTNVYKTEFTYDGKMRRRTRKEYAWQFGNWVLTNEVRYVYAGNLVIQERNAFNLPAVAYTRGIDLSGAMENAGGIGGLLARSDQSAINSAPSTSYYHCDGNGNVTMLINALQLPVAKYLYTPFGYVLAASGPLAEANLYRFSSKEHHPGSGLYYYGRRFYEPNLQRWLNRDTIGEVGGVNLYGAIRNDPLNFYDAFGADPGTLSMFWQNVKQNWGSDAGKFLGKVGANAVDMMASSVKQFVLGPLVTGYEQYQSFVNLSQKLGHLSAEPCARQQLLNNLLNYALTPEGIADIATTIELTLAGGLGAAEADIGALANTAERTATRATQLEFNFAKEFGQNSGLVIGRGADLAAPRALGAGEYKLGWFSVQSTSGTEAQWAVNQAKLQNVVNLNLPIRDASSLLDTGGLFLNRERAMLQSAGWNYQGGSWVPPTH